MKNNKGFSLVELIIVIAIMAILVGVMAPQLIKYIEKTNVSSDTQLCDSVRTAVTTAMMDPAVINATTPGIPDDDEEVEVADLAGDAYADGAFASAVAEIMGYEDVADLAEINGKIKSAHEDDSAVTFMIVGSNSVHVYIPGTDNSGKKEAYDLGDTGEAGETCIFVD